MFVKPQKFNSSLSLSVKTISVWRYNDVTYIDLDLHGKDSTVVVVVVVLLWVKILIPRHASLSPALAWKILFI